MSPSARRLSGLLAALFVVSFLAPNASALLFFSATGGQESARASVADGNTLYDVDVKAAGIVILTLGPLEYILNETERAIDELNGDGMECVYGDPEHPRTALVCTCLELTWNCHDELTTYWTCWASAGPTPEKQVGIICLPPRNTAPVA